MERMGREEILAMYKPDVERLVYFLPWLEGKSGSDVSNVYYADENHATLPFPVYDEILLTFLNELSTTVFMDQNYRYLYTRYRMHDYRDELAMIAKADIMSMDILKGILSKYMLGGMTKANLWIEGIEHQIFWKAVQKAKEIVEFWDVPLDVPMIELGGEEAAEEMPEAEEAAEAMEEMPEAKEAAESMEEMPEAEEAAEAMEEMPEAREAAESCVTEPQMTEEVEPEAMQEAEITPETEEMSAAEVSEAEDWEENVEPEKTTEAEEMESTGMDGLTEAEEMEAAPATDEDATTETEGL